VQKYIENPLIIAKRKFDLRQWVVVTDWNPLTIYFYDEYYARFSVDEYVTDSETLENAYAHLVNNSIGKNSENFEKTVKAENGVNIDGYMWSCNEFKNYINYLTEHDPIKKEPHIGNSDDEANDGNNPLCKVDKIQTRIEDIARWSLMCASEMIEHRKNSFELFGFDYMIDDEYNAWLIEINSSPACDYSTKVVPCHFFVLLKFIRLRQTTERYVQKALVELLNVVIEHKEWEGKSKKSKNSEFPEPSTGGWKCIYKGPTIEKPAAGFGVDLV
jgi:tubulin monoglycylase TTLL3/8